MTPENNSSKEVAYFFDFDLFNGYDLDQLDNLAENDMDTLPMEDLKTFRVNRYLPKVGNLKRRNKVGSNNYSIQAIPHWLPYAFKACRYGAWLSAEGKILYKKANGYDDLVLKTSGVDIPTANWTFSAWALCTGYVKIDYWQSMDAGNLLNFSKFIKRKVTYTIHTDTLHGEIGNVTRLRLNAISNFYWNFFQNLVEFHVKVISVPDPKSGKTVVSELFEDVSFNPAFLNLFLSKMAGAVPSVSVMTSENKK